MLQVFSLPLHTLRSSYSCKFLVYHYTHFVAVTAGIYLCTRMILETPVVMYLFAPFMQPDNTLSRSQKLALYNVQEVDESSTQSGASQDWVYIRSNMYVYTRQSTWNPNSNTLEPDRPHYYKPNTCCRPTVIFKHLQFHRVSITAWKNSTPIKTMLLFR